MGQDHIDQLGEGADHGEVLELHAVLRVVEDAGVFEALDAGVGLIDGCVGLEGGELGGES